MHSSKKWLLKRLAKFETKHHWPKINWFFVSSRILIVLLLSWIVFFLPIKSDAFLEKVEKPIPQLGFDIPVADYPVLGSEPLPSMTAKSFVVLDGKSMVELASRNPDERIYPASLTKLMTALVALEYYDPQKVFTVKRLVKVEDESDMGLAVGDNVSVINLLYGLLIPSGNDAAYALADNFPGGIENFVFAMNKKARQLSMNQTHFVNPSGMDAPNHYSSARDLIILASQAMKNPTIKQIVGVSSLVLSDANGTKTYRVKNVNRLLDSVNGVEGVKTGFTDLAGQCLITSTTRNGHTVYTIVLHSQDRFLESVKLLEWAFRNTSWKDLNP